MAATLQINSDEGSGKGIEWIAALFAQTELLNFERAFRMRQLNNPIVFGGLHTTSFACRSSEVYFGFTLSILRLYAQYTSALRSV